MRFVIIGGDAAGMSAASRAKRNSPELTVTVLEKTEDVSYSACGMPYNIAETGRVMEDLVVRQAHVFREKQGIDLRTGHSVEEIDRNSKKVKGTNSAGEPFEVAYDRLLIATGASPVKPDLPGLDIPGVMVLKTLEDGRRIRDFMEKKSVRKVIIIGMGYIALEMCEAMVVRGFDVEMVKPRPTLLPWMNSNLAGVIREEIESHGVLIHPGREIQSITREQDNLKVICKDLVLEGQMVLVAVGVKPNSEMADRAGLELGPGGAIAVGKDLRTSDDQIFAAGDCADAFHVVTGQRTWIPLALRANRAGWGAADNVTGKNVELEGIAGTAVFKVFDLQVVRSGLSLAEAEKYGFDPVENVIKSRSRAHAHPGSSTLHIQMIGDRTSGRLLGAQMVGKEGVAHRVDAIAVALHQKMTVEAFSQCDLAYAPPFSPVWDPMLTAANQLIKKM